MNASYYINCTLFSRAVLVYWQSLWMCCQALYQIIFLLLYQGSNFLSGKCNVYSQVYNVIPCIHVLGAGLNPRKMSLDYPVLGKARLYSGFNLGKKLIWCLLFRDKNSTANIKIDTLTFLSCILTQHSPTVFHPHISVLLPVSDWILWFKHPPVSWI